MPYTIRKLPNEPIIVFEAIGHYDVRAEIGSVIRDVIKLLEASDEPLFQILIFPDEINIELTDLMTGSDKSARGEVSPFHHPKLRQTIFVTRNPMFGMAAEGLSHDVYGNLHIPVFENYEDALAFVRTQL